MIIELKVITEQLSARFPGHRIQPFSLSPQLVGQRERERDSLLLSLTYFTSYLVFLKRAEGEGIIFVNPHLDPVLKVVMYYEHKPPLV